MGRATAAPPPLFRVMLVTLRFGRLIGTPQLSILRR